MPCDGPRKLIANDIPIEFANAMNKRILLRRVFHPQQAARKNQNRKSQPN